MEFKHYSVLLKETIDNLLNIKGNYVDATCGGGGHSIEICKSNLCSHLYCFDQDISAINATFKRIEDFRSKVTLIHSNFENIKKELEIFDIYKVAGIVADLGVSSYQIDNPERGFSYMKDSFLDMRMDQSNPKTAYDVVNNYTERELLIYSKIMERKSFLKI